MAGTKITTTGVLYINGSQVENTFTNISKVTKKLEGELKKLPIGTKEFIEKAEEVRQARARFEEVKKEIAAVNGALEKSSGVLGFFKKGLLGVGDTFKQVFSANMFERVLDGIVNKGKQTVDELLNIADAMTDVQKTSGMTLEQVKKLWDGFEEMDTRTSKLDRLKIAEVGGRLGVPIEEMKSFVQEVDKAYVALGDSFEGGLEGVVDSLGKIKGLFENTKSMTYAEAINRVGSALNTLAAQGTASEDNISKFALRVGTLPDALKPSIDKVLGLGAAFEEAGIDAQIGSSGFINFLTTAGENIGAFAYSMHMSKKEAEDLLNTKPEEFFLKFSEGMKGLSGTDTAKILQSLKLNSLEVQKAVGAAANKTDDFRKAMKTAGVEMENMTSLQDEFNQKNNNAPAILEKIKNAWGDIFTSTNVINKFEWLIRLVGWLTGVTSDASNGMLVFKERMVFLWNILKVVVATFLSYNTVVLISAISTGSLTKATWLTIVADKAQALAVFAKNVALLAYNVVMGLVTGNTMRARAAIIAFNTTTKMSPLGLLIALVTAAVIAYKVFSKEVDVAAKKQKLLNDVTAEANKGIISQKNELSNLLKVAQDEAASKQARLAAIKKLNEISPEYLGNLTLENINTKKATDAVNAYTDALYRSSRARVLNKKMDAEVEKLEDMKKLGVAETGGKDFLWKMTGGFLKLTSSEAQKLDADMFKQMQIWEKKGGKEYAKEMMAQYGGYYEKRNETLQGTMDNINLIQNELVDLMKKDTAIINSTGNTNTAAPDPDKKKKNIDPAKKANDDLEKAKAEYAKALEASDKNDKELLEAKQKFLDEYYKIVQEGKQKEWDLELQDFDNKKAAIQQENKERLTSNSKLQAEIDKLERDAAETKNPQAKLLFQKAIQEKKSQLIHNLKMIGENQKIEEQMFQTHGFNLLRIEEKWEMIRYQRQAEAFQAATELERKSAEDMINNISSMEEAKQALSQMRFLKLTKQELAGIKTLEEAKKALRENADRAYLASQLKTITAQRDLLKKLLEDPSLSGEAIEKLRKDLGVLDESITKIKGGITAGPEADAKKVQEEGDAAKGAVDVLGFSVKEWENCFDNLDTTAGKLKAVGMAFQALSNAGQMFSELTRSLADRDMRKFEQIQNKKKESLLNQLNTGYLTNEQYNKEIQKMEAETANKKAEMEYKQAKADKVARMFAIVGNTAMGIASALAAPFPINTWLPWIVGAMGAVQLGIVAAQPLPERPSFDRGGFTGSGFGDPDNSGFRPAGIVHQDEWVAPKWMVESPRTAKVIDYLESVRQGKTAPMADGGFVDDKANADQPAKTPGAENNSELLPVLYRLGSFLEYLIKKGVYIEKNAKNGKEAKEMIEEWEALNNKRKH